MGFHTIAGHASEAGNGPACSLDSEQLEERLQEWRSLRAEALISEKVRDGTLHSRYKRSEGVAQRLRALIEAEGRCCPFLEFKLSEQGDVIAVEVRAPAAIPSLIGLSDPETSGQETNGD
jgi:hypothetical protein